jgi:hypothetical protein
MFMKRIPHKECMTARVGGGRICVIDASGIDPCPACGDELHQAVNEGLGLKLMRGGVLDER